MMERILLLIITGAVFAGCATEAPQPEKNAPTQIEQPAEVKKLEVPKEEPERPTLTLPSERQNTSPVLKDTNLVLKEGTKTPFTGMKYSQFPSGKKMEEIPYMNGRKHGPERRWYQNGNMYYEKNFFNGKLHGVVREWNLRGELVKEEKWVNGKLENKIK